MLDIRQFQKRGSGSTCDSGLGSFGGFSFILEDQSQLIPSIPYFSRESVNCARQSSTRIASCVYDFCGKRAATAGLTATKLGRRVPVDDVLNTMQN